MKLLYLCGEVPFPVSSGGKRAIANHLQLLRDQTDWRIEVVAIDADGDRLQSDWDLPADRFSIHCLPRSQPRLRGVAGLLSAARMALLSCHPRSVQVRRSAQSAAMIRSILARGDVDAVVFEHIAAYGMVPQEMPAGIPLIHVSQNVESKVADDCWRTMPWSNPLKLILRFEAAKMARCEGELMRRVDGTICISVDDAAVLGTLTPRAVLGWTEPYWPHQQRWQGAGEHQLLFVGSARYFPNAEALGWLVGKLMPALLRLDPSARLLIAGTSEEELRSLCPGGWPEAVSALGFVPETDKHRLHQRCDLFLCPIVSGSGVKMKLLDSMAYGMAALSTPECLTGVAQGEDAASIGRLLWHDPDQSAAVVADQLAQREQLARLAALSTSLLERRNAHAAEFPAFIAGIAGTQARR